MPLSKEQLEEAVLAFLVFSDEQAAMFALRVGDSSIFANKANEAIAKAAIDYVNKFANPPKEQIRFLLEEKLRQGKEGELLARTITLIEQKYPKYQSDFIISELDYFLESKQLETACIRALELSNGHDLEAAKEALFQNMSIPNPGSPGIWLKEPSQALSFLNKREEEIFYSSGVDALDSMGVRPEKKTFTLIIAPAKKGKTWWLVSVGKGGIQHHHKVLHISLEMSEEKMARRYIQSIFAMTKSEAEQFEVRHFLRDAGNETYSISVDHFTRPGIPEQRRFIANNLVAMNPQLLIKEFPTGSLTIQHLSLYLDSLRRDRHWEPDLLIVDYADLMQLNSDDLRIETGQLYKRLRGLGVTRNLALASASQGNRESEDAKVVGAKHVAEDWSKIGTVDNCITYSQTPEERLVGLARLFVAAARDCEDKFTVMISQAYNIGQFAIDSVLMNKAVIDATNRV